MNYSYINLWNRSLSDMFDATSQLKKMDKLVEESLSSFGEFTIMLQKIGTWGTLFNSTDNSFFNARSYFGETMKTMGIISIDEYRSLVKKYEELKKKSKSEETQQNEQAQKISELNQSAKSEKQKLTELDKTIATNKKHISELKQSEKSLKSELDREKEIATKLQQELTDAKQTVDKLIKENSIKSKATNKKTPEKA